MLYLEDYLELIEGLPGIYAKKLLDLREKNLLIVKEKCEADGDIDNFFKNASEMSQERREKEYQNIKESFEKLLDLHDKSIKLSQELYKKIENYVKKLNIDISNFKRELENDNSGITEKIEERLKQEKRKGSGFAVGFGKYENIEKALVTHPSHNSNNILPDLNNGYNMSTINSPSLTGGNVASNFGIGTGLTHRQMRHMTNLSNPMLSSTSASSFDNNIGIGGGFLNNNKLPRSSSSATSSASIDTQNRMNLSAGSHAIMSAASQAIAATQQLPVGRRTASLKASYEAINSNAGDAADVLSNFCNSLSSYDVVGGSSGGGGPGSDTNSINGLDHPGERSMKKSKFKRSRTNTNTSHNSSNNNNNINIIINNNNINNNNINNNNNLDISNNSSNASSSTISYLHESIHNEPRYCYCNAISYGDMIMCDAKDCPYQWFHIHCVGIKSINEIPEGSWFCPTCRNKQDDSLDD